MGQRPRQMDEHGRVLCPDCSEWKYPEEFFRNTRTKLGISTYCKPCHIKRQPRTGRVRKFTLKEAAAILDLQGYEPERLSPPTDADGNELPDNVRWIAGIGWCKVEPIDKELLAPVPAKRTPKPDLLREDENGKPFSDHKKYEEHLKTLRKKTDNQVKDEARFLPWSDPENEWSVWHRAVEAELIRRFSSDDSSANASTGD